MEIPVVRLRDDLPRVACICVIVSAVLTFVEMSVRIADALCESRYDATGLFPYWFDEEDRWCNPVWHHTLFAVGQYSLLMFPLVLIGLRIVRRFKAHSLDVITELKEVVFVPTDKPASHVKSDAAVAALSAVVLGVLYLFVFGRLGLSRGACEISEKALGFLTFRFRQGVFGCDPPWPAIALGPFAVGTILFLPTFSAVRLVRRIVGVAQRLLPG
ncbi:MAG: hypothetical protein H6843_16335 [Rhodospirillaceae bacterium]|nr:hypothetical protein [Rhodospirillaceae bacterium]